MKIDFPPPTTPPPAGLEAWFGKISTFLLFFVNQNTFAGETTTSHVVPKVVFGAGYFIAAACMVLMVFMAFRDHTYWRKYMGRLNAELDEYSARAKEEHDRRMGEGREPWKDH